jgi:hypothetical protein
VKAVALKEFGVLDGLSSVSPEGREDHFLRIGQIRDAAGQEGPGRSECRNGSSAAPSSANRAAAFWPRVTAARNSSKSVLASVMFRFPQIARQAGSHAIHSL